jgi:hypothetical protein
MKHQAKAVSSINSKDLLRVKRFPSFSIGISPSILRKKFKTSSCQIFSAGCQHDSALKERLMTQAMGCFNLLEKGKDEHMRKRLLSALALAGTCLASPSYANWTLNLGYHNPMNADLGVNFLYWGSQWNFEVGIGWVDADAKATDDKDEAVKDDDGVGLALAGDLNVKYRFVNGTIAPYVQLGIGAWTSAAVGDQTDANADLGGPFAGIGLMIGKPNLYVYAAYNVDKNENDQVQAGIGFDI